MMAMSASFAVSLTNSSSMLVRLQQTICRNLNALQWTSHKPASDESASDHQPRAAAANCQLMSASTTPPWDRLAVQIGNDSTVPARNVALCRETGCPRAHSACPHYCSKVSIQNAASTDTAPVSTSPRT